MATFHIYEDAEKENPAPAGILKERTVVRVGGAGGVGAGLVGRTIKQNNAGQTNHMQTRSNLAILNENANMGKGFPGAVAAPHGANKLSLRQKNNKNGNVAPLHSVVEQKKSTVVPVVEQFKSFSVYEDQSNDQTDHANVYVKSIQEQITIAQSKTTVISKNGKANEKVITINEKNTYISTQLDLLDRQHNGIKNDSLHKDFGGIIDNETAFNTTPMSVSDVLSPMSVDRSNLSLFPSSDKENQPFMSEAQANDDSTINIVDKHLTADQQEKQLKLQTEQHQQKRDKSAIPRNDRQRFFEVVEYQEDILEYFREAEKKHRPKPHYMRRQQDISYSMRTILVDWLVEVSEEYNLDTETLYLSISYIDRFLSHMSVVRSKLQLVGTAAMYIAAKYEEIYPPDVGEFVFITDDTYTKAQVLRMEQLILKILSFDLCTPTPLVFVNTYAVLTDMTNDLKFLTMYICELSLLDADPYLRFVPSIISAAAHALARYLLVHSIWTTQLEEVTKYRLEDLKEVFLHLCKTHKAALKLPQQAIVEKYRNKKYNEVSNIKPVDITCEHYDEMTAKYNELLAAEKSNLAQQQAMMTADNENVRRMISLMFNN